VNKTFWEACPFANKAYRRQNWQKRGGRYKPFLTPPPVLAFACHPSLSFTSHALGKEMTATLAVW